MPRSTKSRQLREKAEAAAEQETLHPDGSAITIDQDATEAERAAYEEMLGVPVEHTPDWNTAPGATDEGTVVFPDAPATDEAVDVNELSDAEVKALHARDFDWDTMRWSPPKGNGGGNRLCMCNRIAGEECDLTTKSRFSIGHDARFKSILQKAWREGRNVKFSFVPEDNAVVTAADGSEIKLSGEVELAADAIARLVAPKLLPHVTHQSRAAKLQILDAEAGTTVPQTAVEHKADEELTDADVAAQPEETADAGFQEA